MKLFTKTMAILGLSLTMVGVASASTQYVAADDSASSKICVAALKNSKIKLMRTIKDSRLTKRFVAENVTCNGLPIVEFVEQNSDDSHRVNAFITNGQYETKGIIASVESAK